MSEEEQDISEEDAVAKRTGVKAAAAVEALKARRQAAANLGPVVSNLVWAYADGELILKEARERVGQIVRIILSKTKEDETDAKEE